MLFPHLESFLSSPLAKNFRPTLGPSKSVVLTDGEPIELPDVGGPLHAVLCIQAAIFRFFFLVSECDRASGLDDTESLQACIKITDAVNRGSEVHTLLTARVLFAQIQAGRNSSAEVVADKEGVKAATNDCYVAHLARYGPLSPSTVSRLFWQSEVSSRNLL